MEDTHQNRLMAAVIAAIALVVLMLRLFDPATSGIFPPCPVRYLTGWYCPGCGSLRAIHQLLHGNLQAAWAMNPLAVLLLPLVGYGLAAEAFVEVRGQRLTRWILPGFWIQVLAAIIVGFGVVRNLPLYPFNLLAPGAMLHP